MNKFPKFEHPVDMQKVDGEEGGRHKAIRMNVGFSRAKESIRFVLSKNIDEIRGEAGRALRYFHSQLDKPDYMRLAEKTDPKSPMELVLLNLMQQPPFIKQNNRRVEIVPQFPISDYIKQLDPAVDIPRYTNDFLVTFRLPPNKSKMVLVEYDGFAEHFKNRDTVTANN